MRAAAILMLALATQGSVLAEAATAGPAEDVQVDAPLHQFIEREAVRLAHQSPNMAPHASRRSWPGRHPVALGMLIGLGGGIAWGSAKYYEGERPFGPFIALGAGVGVGIGAGVGAVISAVTH